MNPKLGYLLLMVALIRHETPADHDAVRNVNLTAFGGVAEAWLVDRLRDDGEVIVSMVAEEQGQVVGHILFSRVVIDTAEGPVTAAALAPMAVLPEFQCKGVGSALVRAGLDACREEGEAIAVVIGHRNYYPRFGFSPELAKPLKGPWSGDAFMAAELTPGALAGISGPVRYADAFGIFG